MKFRNWVISGFLVLGAALAFLAVPVAAQAPSPPINDAYLNSLELNGPGTKLNNTATLEDMRDTSNATVQTNILNPCGRASCPSGPAEVTTCQGISYGKTVWYDFYPNTNGTVQIRTSGFDNVIALYQFNLNTAIPGQPQCVHNSSFPSEQMTASVQKGKAYTIQVGGVNNAGGPLQFLFDFFSAPPHRLSAQSTLEAKQTSNGIQLVGLSVQTSRAAKVTVKCSRGCRSESKTKQATETFPHLKGTRLKAGSKLKIYVTAKGSIGAYIEYDVTRGNFKKLNRCLEPGSSKPRKSCH
ncbi:MAG: hypothetical protein WAK93_01525 [Solirubrobacteraceae bacterium]